METDEDFRDSVKRAQAANVAAGVALDSLPEDLSEVEKGIALDEALAKMADAERELKNARAAYPDAAAL